MKLRRIVCLMLVLSLCLAQVPAAFAAEDRAMGKAGLETEQQGYPVMPQDRIDPPTAFGIDVSHHQGVIDWDAVATQIDFAIIRCGYGDDLTNQDDRQWYRNVEECTRLGIPFGVYIYSYALSEEEAHSEADHVLRLLEGYKPTLPVYYDLEDDSIRDSCTPEQILDITRIFCERIEAAGHRAGVYANYNWWTNYLTFDEYERWDRWIARYNVATGYNLDYTIWQYSCTGSLEGIEGNVDLNNWYGPFPSKGTVTGVPVDLGETFTASVQNKALSLLIENRGETAGVGAENAAAVQLWQFQRQDDGSYQISSCLDGRYLSVADGSDAPGAQIHLAEGDDTPAQRWYIYEAAEGYVLKAKCTGCVLDLAPQLQMNGENGSKTQIWAINRGENYSLQAPVLSVAAGSSINATIFTWDDVPYETRYDLTIWKDVLGEGEAFHAEANAASGYEIMLPPGTYHAYVEAGHYFESIMSGVVTFAVEEVSYTISYDANGGSGAPGVQTKIHGENAAVSTVLPERFGYQFLGWSTAADAVTAEYLPGEMFAIDADTTLYAVWEEVYDIAWKEATTSLNGTIDLNLYVVLSDSVVNDPTTVCRFTYAGKTVDVPMADALPSVRGGVECYRFSCPMYAKQVADTVTIEMLCQGERVGKKLEYSIMRFCYNRIEKSSDPKTVAMCKAMLNYAAAAQLAFNYNTENLANANLPEADQVLSNVNVSGFKASRTGTEAGLKIKIATLLVESAVSVRVYFTLEEGYDISDYTFTVNGKEVTPAHNSQGWYIESEGIAAKRLDQLLTFTLGNITINYGPMVYVQNMLTKGSPLTVELVKAMYLYHVAAKALLG